MKDYFFKKGNFKMTLKDNVSFEVKVLVAILGFGLSVHLTVGLMTAYLDRAAEQRHIRLKPRHLAQTEVRGETYHVHNGKTVDLKVQENYARRRRNVESLRPHFIAKRQILAHDYDEKAISDNLFYKLIGGQVGSLKMKCTTCSIVGSAGTLTSAKTGKEIDNSECVFRLGVAPINDFEEDVGTKTTIRVIDGRSFTDLLRRPEKLIEGSLASTNWIIFDHSDVDIMKLNFKLLPLKQINPNLRVYFVTRRGESQALSEFKTEAGKLGYKLPGAVPSTLWYAIQAMTESKCEKLTIFGVPDAKYCKQSQSNSLSKSRYWGYSSPPFCSLGKDSGIGNNTAEAQSLSLNDRRALLGLVKNNTIVSISFRAPSWVLSNRT